MDTKEPLVTIYTQVYNTRPFLKQCVESVLGQTYPDFEYVLIDNGSTDGSKEVLEQYAAQDGRVRVIRFEKNRAAPIWMQTAREITAGKYVAVLDSDDWWEPNYLESLIGFLEKNHLDLAVTGTINYFEATRTSQVMRKLDTPIVLSCGQFAERYPEFWAFPSTNWANIMHIDLVRKIELSEILELEKMSNGADTAFMLKYMAQCDRIGIDDTVLYHYRIRPKQISRQYNSRRFDSNVYCSREIQRFLELHHTFDRPKQKWLGEVYANLIGMTLRLLSDSKLPPDNKAAECARIVSHPLTAAAMDQIDRRRKPWFQTVWEITLKAAADDSFTDLESQKSILTAVAPRCGSAVTKETAPLFGKEAALMDALYQDDPDRLAEALLELAAVKRYTKQYDLAGMIQILAQDKPLLRGISDIGFIRKYKDIYWMVWQDHTLDALDAMTGLLLENKVQSAEEAFLQLYLSIAALLEQIPAFIFGKIRLADFYLRHKAPDQCQVILAELTEMGMQDEEEVKTLYSELEAYKCNPG